MFTKNFDFLNWRVVDILYVADKIENKIGGDVKNVC
jgi:hypothetical protein